MPETIDRLQAQTEQFDATKQKLLSIPDKAVFPFNGGVITVERTSSAQIDIASKTVNNGSSTSPRSKTVDAYAHYRRTHFTFRQGPVVIKVDFSPETSILIDQEGRGARGTYQTRKDRIDVRVGDDVKNETFCKKGDEFDDKMKLLAQLCDAHNEYDPNKGGLADIIKGFSVRAKQSSAVDEREIPRRTHPALR